MTLRNGLLAGLAAPPLPGLPAAAAVVIGFDGLAGLPQGMVLTTRAEDGFTISFAAAGSQDLENIVLTEVSTSVPGPASLALLGAGLLGLGVAARRRRRG